MSASKKKTSAKKSKPKNDAIVAAIVAAKGGIREDGGLYRHGEEIALSPERFAALGDLVEKA